MWAESTSATSNAWYPAPHCAWPQAMQAIMEGQAQPLAKAGSQIPYTCGVLVVSIRRLGQAQRAQLPLPYSEHFFLPQS